jgi:hypothetical protein
LNRYCIGHQVYEGISGKTPEGDLLMWKQVQQATNGRWTNAANGLKSLEMEIFVVTVEKSS